MPHHSIGAQLAGALLDLGEGDLAGLAQFRLVGSGAAADDVADTGEQVLEDVRAEHGLTGHHAQVLGDGPALHVGRGGHDHGGHGSWLFSAR